MAGLSLSNGLALGSRRGAPATPAPAWTVQPSISGSPVVGQTLTGNDGTITNGTVISRAWLRNGSVISGATGGTYLLVIADDGANIAFRPTATGPGGPASATSPSVGPVTSGAPAGFSWLTSDQGGYYTDDNSNRLLVEAA